LERDPFECPVDENAIAFHEAGHAVIACHLGRRLRQVSVDFRRGLGLTETTCPPALTEADVRQEVMILLAGGEAEYRFAPYRRRFSAGARFDIGRAFRLIRDLLDSKATTQDRRWIEPEAERVAKSLAEDVRLLIEQPVLWRGVRAAAAALLTQGRLPGMRAEAIIRMAAGF
jgi:hypothetical protein